MLRILNLISQHHSNSESVAVANICIPDLAQKEENVSIMHHNLINKLKFYFVWRWGIVVIRVSPIIFANTT